MEKLQKNTVSRELEKHLLLFDNAEALKKAIGIIEEGGGRVLHQFGRILLANLSGKEQAILRKLPTKTQVLNEDTTDEKLLTSTERLGLHAYRKRSSSGFVALKNRQATDDSLWQDDGTTQDDHEEVIATKTRTQMALTGEEILPLPERLINKNAMAIVIVDGVAPDRQISFAEKVNIVTELQETMEWIEDFRPSANVSWAYDIYEPTVDAVPWQGAPFKKMPDAWYDGWDASVTNSQNGKMYAFKGSEYIRFSNVSNGMDAGYPKPIAGNWKNLPANWNTGSFDTALWREQNQKIYIFKGSEYIRVDPSNFTMDAGYPRPIAGSWKNLPTEFESNIDVAIGHKSNNSIYLFKGDQYVRFSNGSTTMDAGYPRSIAGNWKNMPQAFAENGLSAGFWRDSNDKIYLFQNSRWGAKYVRITPDDFTVEASYTNGIYTGLSKDDAEALWRDPALVQLGVDGSHDGGRQLAANLKASTNSDHAITVYVTKHAVVHFAYAGGYRWTYSQPNLSGNLSTVMIHETMHLYGAPDEYLDTSSCTSNHGRFFTAKNSNSVACDPTGQDCIMRNNTLKMCNVTPLHIGWGPFENKIDAAVCRGDSGKTYLFSGDQYIRYTDISNGRDEGFPRKISGAWKGLPASFKSNLDAALWREDNQALYLFKGSQYVRYSSGSNTMDAGYPTPIAGNWVVPAAFESDIDAAFWRDSNNKIYMFKGNQYIRLSIVANKPTMDAGYPKLISSAWLGLPNSFKQGIDTALMRRETGQMYLFRGGRYVRYSNEASDGIDAGFPAWINNNWMPFPRNY